MVAATRPSLKHSHRCSADTSKNTRACVDQARISPLFSHDVDPVRFTRGISQPGRHCRVEESVGEDGAAVRTGAAAGKGRETRERRKGSFGCRRKEKHFAAAFLSHARCKIHRITPTACSYHGEEGEGESEKERGRKGGREKGFPTYVHQNFFIARSLADGAAPPPRPRGGSFDGSGA